VSRIFFMHEKSIFNQADILNEKNFEMLFGLSRTLEKTILKALGLRWLKMDMNKKISVLREGGNEEDSTWRK
jgi:hypothetical protein